MNCRCDQRWVPLQSRRWIVSVEPELFARLPDDPRPLATVRCAVCRNRWRTRAAYAAELPAEKEADRL